MADRIWKVSEVALISGLTLYTGHNHFLRSFSVLKHQLNVVKYLDILKNLSRDIIDEKQGKVKMGVDQ